MKRLRFTLALLVTGCAPQVSERVAGTVVGASTEGPIVAALDLTAVSDDRVPVTLDPGAFTEAEVLFRLPRVVQGTYNVSDFGRFVEDLVAYAYDGAEMPVQRMDLHTWRIADATRLDRLTYYVNDTYDVEHTDTPTPFSPAGTNIAPEVYVLNLHGFVGYFEGMTEADYELRVTASAGMVRASALPRVASEPAGDAVTDVYRADRYFEVTDNPMMVGALDTTAFSLDGITVTLTLYAPTGTPTAAALRPALERMMAAQRAYLGDLETTDRYDVFLYVAQEGEDAPKGIGALEHHSSTVAVFPRDATAEAAATRLVNVVSHEFFHIVQPLALHSEDIHDFDYHAPTFSKHLWFYEGQTEYFARHFQVYEGLQPREAFYEGMSSKINAAARFDDTMSFTVMSEHILEEPYASSYANVYQKGALIGMCNDVAIRARSGGARSLISVMREFAEEYGRDRPFDDDTFIETFAAYTYPEVGDFLRTHVAGTTPIDYAACLAPVGLTVLAFELPSGLFALSMPLPSGGMSPVMYLAREAGSPDLVFTPGRLNTTLESLGVQGGDVLRSFNGTAYSAAELGALVQAANALTPASEITLVVERDGAEVELRGTLGMPTATRYAIEELPDATPEQRAMRDAWLGGPPEAAPDTNQTDENGP